MIMIPCHQSAICLGLIRSLCHISYCKIVHVLGRVSISKGRPYLVLLLEKSKKTIRPDACCDPAASILQRVSACKSMQAQRFQTLHTDHVHLLGANSSPGLQGGRRCMPHRYQRLFLHGCWKLSTDVRTIDRVAIDHPIHGTQSLDYRTSQSTFCGDEKRSLSDMFITTLEHHWSVSW